MANLLPNAGFLDLATGWAAPGAVRFQVDEDRRGGAGRAALVADFEDVAVDETVEVSVSPNRRPEVTADAEIEVAGAFAAYLDGAAVPPIVSVLFRDEAADLVDAVEVDLTAPFDAHGVALWGLRQTYWQASLRLVVPTDAVSADLVISYQGAGDVTLVILKPQIAAVPPGRVEPLTWSPGPSDNVDLKLTEWPSILRALGRDTRAEARSALVEFMGDDAGRPASRRVTSDPARSCSFSVWCDPVQRAVLEAFARSAPEDFWFVEPDSDRLCVAKFASGGLPKLADPQGHMVRMEGVLWVETA